MPSRIPRPDDLGRRLGDLNRRLKVTEQGGGQAIGLSAVMSPLGTNTQPGGPLTGVAGPPFGPGVAGGEVTLSTLTFTLDRDATVWLIALATDYVSVAAGPFVAAAPVYFQVDGVDDLSAYGSIPVYAGGDTETRALTTTVMLVRKFLKGAHTVKLVWNSQEGTGDSCANSSNPILAFLLPS